ncbi:efflux RND transporter periplasmic adaptor subunit [Hyphococcus formosus]|uniref:efflux RND transporter periplasmic adaptor subunit n=1 Tax=Hyphococcus formosus TaxID=3143534 RepID=UPI00398AA09D
MKRHHFPHRSQIPTLLRTSATIGAAALFLAACGSDAGQNAGGTPPPPEVAVHTVTTETTELSVTLPGRTSAFRMAEVRPQVSGIIQKRLFEEGEVVEVGTPLYQIDDALYKAAHDSAVASLARAEANAVAASNRAERYKKLAKVNGVSQQDYDDAEAAARQARADVGIARANRDTAKVNLDRTVIKAPISGTIGRSLVTDGALVTSGQAQELAVINMLDPIFVDLTQSSTELLRLKRKLANGELQTLDNDQLSVSLTLEDGTTYEHQGSLELTEPSVTPETGSVVLRAQFPNPDGLLIPGMFVRANITEGKKADAILVPQQSVTRDEKGNGITYVVKDDNSTEIRMVKTDRAIGDQWLIADGLEAGERIVYEGFQRIRPGTPVTPVEIALADAELKVSSNSGAAGSR